MQKINIVRVNNVVGLKFSNLKCFEEAKFTGTLLSIMSTFIFAFLVIPWHANKCLNMDNFLSFKCCFTRRIIAGICRI